jgi:probable phosphoglycerate mutase
MTRDDEAGGTELWLVRHGPTEWSSNGRHTGRTDIPLTEVGEKEAAALAPRLAAVRFDRVLVSPLQRARRTAELAGFPDGEIEPLLQEWDYGDYEGLTRRQIREHVPGWTAWSHPMPGGESLEQVAQRACDVFDRVAEGGEGRVLLVAHGHFLRILATRWMDTDPRLAERLALDPATISVLGYDRGTPVVQRWNDHPD